MCEKINAEYLSAVYQLLQQEFDAVNQRIVCDNYKSEDTEKHQRALGLMLYIVKRDLKDRLQNKPWEVHEDIFSGAVRYEIDHNGLQLDPEFNERLQSLCIELLRRMIEQWKALGNVWLEGRKLNWTTN